MGLLVALKQLGPDRAPLAARLGGALNLAPLGFVCVSAVSAAVGSTTAGTFVHALTSFQTAYIYLRYFRQCDEERGDRSDEFAYHTFYPEFLHPVVSPIARVAYLPFRHLLEPSNAVKKPAMSPAPVPTSADPMEAERRRQRALRALNERLGTSTSAPVALQGQTADAV